MKVFKNLAQKHRSPQGVQKFLRKFPYNRELEKETLRSALSALNKKSAHCFEAALIAAAILKHLGFPPLLLSIDSVDDLDHVLFVYKSKGKWGSIGRSRDDGLHGRPPIFRSIRDLVWSYFDPYVDSTGRIKGYTVFSLDQTGLDWKSSSKNLWALDAYRISLKHTRLKSSDRRYKKLFAFYKKFGFQPKKKIYL